VRQAASQGRNEFGRFQGASLRLGTGLGGLRVAATALVGPLGAVFAAFSGVALVKEAVTTFAEFEQQLANLAAVSGATGDQLKELETIARDIGTSTQFSASQAASGLVELAKAGLTVEQQAASLPSVLALATAGQLELAEASEIVVRSLAQFQIGAEQSARVADVLTAAANASTTDVRDLALAFSFVGSTANAVGLDIESTASFLSVLANNAQNGARGGTALRGVISTLIRPTAEASKELQKLGINFNEIDVRSVGLQAALERLASANLDARSAGIIFGREVAAGALALVENTKAAKDFDTQLRNSNGTAKAFGDTVTNSLSGSFKELKASVQELFIVAGEDGFGGALRDLVDLTTDVVRALAGVTVEAEGVNDAVDYTLAVFEELAIGFGETIDVIGDLIESLVNGVRDGLQFVIGFFGDAYEFIEQTFNDLGTSTNEVFGGIFQLWKDYANGIIAFFRTIGQVAGKVLNAIYDQVQFSLDALDQLLAGNVEQAKTIAANSATLFNRQIEAAFRDVGGRFKKNFDEDVVGQGLNLGKDFAFQFKEGVDAVLEGDFEFARRVGVNVDSRRAARAQRDAAREARRQRGAAGVPQGPGGDVNDPFDDAREDPVVSTRLRILDDIEREIQLVGLSNEARERAIAIATLQEQAEQAFGRRLEDNDPIMVQFIQRLDELQQKRELAEFFDDIGSSAKDAFKEFATGAKTAEEALLSFFDSIGNKALDKLTDGIFDAIFSGGPGIGGGGGGLFGLFRGLLGFAEGGRPPVGRPSVVGEKGPELFVPDGPGTIVPNGATIGGNVSVINVLDPKEVLGALNSADGERVVLNIIRRNRRATERS
jgi:TP901 family phage tail tape measure protein